MSFRRVRFSAVIALVAGLHGLLLLPLPLLVQTVAALLLAGFLPGALLVEWLVGRSAAPPDGWERVLYSVGVGYGIITVILLGLSYLPGGLAAWQVYLVVDVLLLILLSFPRSAWERRDDAPRQVVPPTGTRSDVLIRSVQTAFPRRSVGTSKGQYSAQAPVYLIRIRGPPPSAPGCWLLAVY